VLDVKVGDGAFMKARADAERLADVMIDLGRRAGREVVAVISDMDEPLGHAVGNALEIREAIATLRGDGRPDFVQLVVEAATRLCTSVRDAVTRTTRSTTPSASSVSRSTPTRSRPETRLPRSTRMMS